MGTLHPKVERIEGEVPLGLHEDHAVDVGARVVEGFLCFDVDQQILVSGAGVSHSIISV